jgi:hypothetical protein
MQPALMDMKQMLLIAVILVLAVILSHFARRAIGRYWLHSSRRMNVHPSNYRIFKNAASVVTFTLAMIAVLHLLPSPKGPYVRGKSMMMALLRSMAS